MGWSFQLKDANIVAYLTTSEAKPPDVTYRHLSRFLTGLEKEWDQAFISSDESWPAKIGRKASAISGQIPESLVRSQERIYPDEFGKLIEPLREEFQDYDFYALA